MERGAVIYVAGHRGLVGSAIVRALARHKFTNVITRSHEELDLTDQASVRQFFSSIQPKYVFLAAAKVGGIAANDAFPAEFIHQNIAIQTNVIHESHRAGVERLMFLGSSCIYPRECAQPIREEYLLTGALEATNRAYAIAKIAGIEMCRSYNAQHGTHFLAVMPPNLYGPGDNFDPETSHVLPALVRKMHEARQTKSAHAVIWGTGQPRREFMASDDLADALLFLINLGDDRLLELTSQTIPMINVGWGNDQTIREIACLVREVVGFPGELLFDPSRPDGTPRKVLDTTRMNQLGWKPRKNLREGVVDLYNWYLASLGDSAS